MSQRPPSSRGGESAGYCDFLCKAGIGYRVAVAAVIGGVKELQERVFPSSERRGTPCPSVNLLKELATRLHAHVADRVAPVAVAGGAADGAHVNGISGTGRQTAEKHRPGPRKQAAGLPGATDTVRSDRRLLQFVRPGVKHLLHVYRKLPGVAVIDDRDGRLRQWQLCTDGRGGLEPAREQRGKIVVAVALNVTGELAQKRNQLTALFVFVGGGVDAARRMTAPVVSSIW